MRQGKKTQREIPIAIHFLLYREAEHVFDHTTSRQCDDPSCKGQLKDSIINFGENLPEIELKKAFDHAQKVLK